MGCQADIRHAEQPRVTRPSAVAIIDRAHASRRTQLHVPALVHAVPQPPWHCRLGRLRCHLCGMRRVGHAHLGVEHVIAAVGRQHAAVGQVLPPARKGHRPAVAYGEIHVQTAVDEGVDHAADADVRHLLPVHVVGLPAVGVRHGVGVAAVGESQSHARAQAEDEMRRVDEGDAEVGPCGDGVAEVAVLPEVEVGDGDADGGVVPLLQSPAVGVACPPAEA